MKVWVGQGSEHSANLVMLGRFSDEERARDAEDAFRRLTDHAMSDLDDESGARDPDAGFSDEMFELLTELKAYSLGPVDVDQFAYDYRLRREGNEIAITTDELDVQGFLKVMIDRGAKVEVFSAHAHATEHGRNTRGDRDDASS